MSNNTTKTGVLLVNLGTPDAPTPSAVRRYLKQFLSDRRVIEVPRPLWFFILRVILLIRPSRSAKAYQEVWTEQGSPLLTISKQQAAALQTALDETLGETQDGTLGETQDETYHVELGMSYGSPSIPSALNKLADCDHIKILPLYPQYSGTTTASVFDAISDYYQQQRVIPNLAFIRDYHDHPLYIQALAASVNTHWEAHGRADKFIMSFHGIPQRYVDNGDIYAAQCQRTAELLAAELNLTTDDWLLTFQSRVGREPWLQPYTDKTMQSLPQQGINTVDVICPGFSVDCLETLEEIRGENAEYFVEAGGTKLRYIPCLNEASNHIKLLSKLI